MKLGDAVGRFTVLKKLSTGAMASVYLGLDPDAERLVCVKMLFPELASDEKARKRFQREAAILRSLEHPAMVRLIESSDLKQPFMVLEHLRGQPLGKLLEERGALPLNEALPLIKQVARSLAVAHARGIIHRNITPHNLWIEEGSGVIKILDFGVARVNDDQLKTSLGKFLGTLAYAAPEQVQGLEVDARADLYAAGAVFYQMLTGKVPRPGETLAPLTTGLDRAIRGLLKQDRSERTASVEEFLRQLEMFEGQLRLQQLGTRTVQDVPELAEEYQRVMTAFKAKRYDDALPLAESLCRRAPGAAEAHFLLGEVQVERGHVYQAIQAYTKATVLDPENAHYPLAVGLAYEALDMQDQARAAYETALKLDPASRLAQDQLSGLGRRKAEPEVAPVTIVEEGVEDAPAAPEPAVEAARPPVRRRSDIVTHTLAWWGWPYRETGRDERSRQISYAQAAVVVAAVIGLASGLVHTSTIGAMLGVYVVISVYFIEEALRSFDRLELQGRLMRDGGDKRPIAINVGRVHGVTPTTVFNVYREDIPGTCRGALIGRLLVRDVRDDVCTGEFMKLGEVGPRIGDYAVAMETIGAGLVNPEAGRPIVARAVGA